MLLASAPPLGPLPLLLKPIDPQEAAVVAPPVAPRNVPELPWVMKARAAAEDCRLKSTAWTCKFKGTCE